MLLLISSKILLVVFANTPALSQRTIAEGEIFAGPTITVIEDAEGLRDYVGVAFGGSINAHIARNRFCSLGLTLRPYFVFGETPSSDGIDAFGVGAPLGLLFSVGDNGGLGGSGSVGGSFALGYGLFTGGFAEERLATRPFMSIDISLGVFKRGTLKFRYSTTLQVEDPSGVKLSSHLLTVIGTTLW